MPLMTCAPKRETSVFMPISAQISDHGPVTMVNSYRLSSTVSAAPRQTKHIGAETGRTALASALQTDAAAEQHRKGEPHYDRGEMKFAQVLYHSTHLM